MGWFSYVFLLYATKSKTVTILTSSRIFQCFDVSYDICCLNWGLVFIHMETYVNTNKLFRYRTLAIDNYILNYFKAYLFHCG